MKVEWSKNMGKKSRETKVSIKLFGLLLCLLLMQTTFAAENSPVITTTEGNTTFDNVTVANVTPETIELQSSYLSDSIEAGKMYTYQIKIKNVASKDITIDPKISDSFYPVGYSQAFGNDSITICAPSTIKAGSVATMILKINVPESSTGSYNGNINLNVDGQVNDGSSPQLSLGFTVWKQPTTPYVKTFNATTNDPITIDVSTYNYNSDMGLRISPKDKDPSLDIGLTHDGNPVNLTLVKSVDSGNPNVISSYPGWSIESGSLYQDFAKTHVETYKVQGAIGNWKLSILPHNSNGFTYSITVGNNT
jgi:hypothetical protein